MPGHCDHGALLTASEVTTRTRERGHDICRTEPARRCAWCGQILLKVESAKQVLHAMKVPTNPHKP